MARALALAARGDWRVAPNPRVGAVLSRGDEVLAEGFHAACGGPHAEAEALAALAARGLDARGATLTVTLEPCGPFPGKRTPPCVEALLQAGVARVVVGRTDPHPPVAGRSLERLRAAGVEVVTGVLEAEARRLTSAFAKWALLATPHVTAKWAMSLDGRIAARTGDSRWITGPAARRDAHRLRGEVDAVAVGIGTALADDPELTRRDAPGGDPLRVVVDSGARLPLASKLVASARTRPLLVAVGAGAPAERVLALEAAGAAVERLGSGERVDPRALLAALARRGARTLLVEGGGALLAGFFEAGCVDRVVAYVAPKVIGGDGAPGPVRGLGVDLVARARALEGLLATTVGEDVALEGHVVVY